MPLAIPLIARLRGVVTVVMFSTLNADYGVLAAVLAFATTAVSLFSFQS